MITTRCLLFVGSHWKENNMVLMKGFSYWLNFSSRWTRNYFFPICHWRFASSNTAGSMLHCIAMAPKAKSSFERVEIKQPKQQEQWIYLIEPMKICVWFDVFVSYSFAWCHLYSVILTSTQKILTFRNLRSWSSCRSHGEGNTLAGFVPTWVAGCPGKQICITLLSVALLRNELVQGAVELNHSIRMLA